MLKKDKNYEIPYFENFITKEIYLEQTTLLNNYAIEKPRTKYDEKLLAVDLTEKR